MPRLIDADKLKADFIFFGNRYGTQAIEFVIDQQPTVDAVKHGHWNEAKDGTLWCSVCTSTGPYDEDSWGYVIHAPHYDYCPHCGAKMDEEGEDETD